VHGAVDRVTRDLDFFCPAAHSVDVLAPAAERVLLAEGFSVERVLDNPGFVRLVVVGDDDRTEVDLGSDARLFPLEQGLGFQLLSTEELAVDKVPAVFGRAEARDFMDLQSVEARFGLDRLLALAADKDHGFDLIVFSEMTGRFDQLRRDEFPIDEEHYEQLAQRVATWRIRARDLVVGKNRTHEPDRDRGDDLGIGF
jgi:hypothetical protein